MNTTFIFQFGSRNLQVYHNTSISHEFRYCYIINSTRNDLNKLLNCLDTLLVVRYLKNCLDKKNHLTDSYRKMDNF